MDITDAGLIGRNPNKVGISLDSNAPLMPFAPLALLHFSAFCAACAFCAPRLRLPFSFLRLLSPLRPLHPLRPLPSMLLFFVCTFCYLYALYLFSFPVKLCPKPQTINQNPMLPAPSHPLQARSSPFPHSSCTLNPI